jgi:riboflavin biosynthesis pyrimidine reductase
MIASPPRSLTGPALVPLLVADAPRRPARGGLPVELSARYGSDLWIPLREDRPTVVANFVSTLDGVVSYATPEAAGGGEVSGFFEPDRFVMSLLRALADVVLVGAGTVRAAPHEAWTPAFVHPPSGASVARLRHELGLAPNPVTAVVTASGELDLTHPGLSDPTVDVVLLTTERGAMRLARQRVPAHVEVITAGRDSVAPAALLAALGQRGARLVLCEGGPHLFGELLGERLIDELFLTIAPQVAGRGTSTPRLALVEGTAFDVADARWGDVVDLRRSGSHLFTRYRI